MNTQVARSAEAVSGLLTDHVLPAVACVDITPDRIAGSVRTAVQLAACTAELAALIAFAESLSGDVVASVLRREAFTQVQVEGDAADLPVTAWTHPAESELSALWQELGRTPDVDVRTRVDLAALRAAASAVADSAQEAAA